MKNLPKNMSEDKIWFLYILECSDGTYYTGITTDLIRRESEHNSSTSGAKYTRFRRPVKIVFSAEAGSHSDALKLELEIKSKGRKYKEKIIKNGFIC